MEELPLPMGRVIHMNCPYIPMDYVRSHNPQDPWTLRRYSSLVSDRSLVFAPNNSDSRFKQRSPIYLRTKEFSLLLGYQILGYCSTATEVSFNSACKASKSTMDSTPRMAAIDR